VERASDRVDCAECGSDVTAQNIRFQDEKGSTLCERCYGVSRSGGEPLASARAIVMALRIAAYVVLAITFVSVLLRMSVPDFAMFQIALYGTFAFLIFIALGEGIGILLIIHRHSMENRLKLKRILDTLEQTGALPSVRNGSQTL